MTYVFTSGGTRPLSPFLLQNRPSQVTALTTDWIWLRRADTESPETEEWLQMEAINAGKSILNNTIVKLRHSASSESTQIREEAKKELQLVAENFGMLGGKWLVYASTANIDAVWEKLAISFDHGDLATTKCHGMKVSTAAPSQPHVICVYLPNIFDQTAAGEVLAVLREMGIKPQGAKPDLYTLIELYAKHPSGISPTLWKVGDFEAA